MTKNFMRYSLKFVGRTRLRAPLFAALFLLLASCDSTESLTSETSAAPEPAVEVVDVDIDESVDPDAASLLVAPMASVQFAGGIPFGTSAQPTSAFVTPLNGALRNIYPQYLLRHLAQIKARGGKVVLVFASDKTVRDANGFSMTMWKARVDRYKNVNFSSYIEDGTIIGHYLIDEPNNAGRWKRPISPAVIEELAKYSKQRWPTLVTIVRTNPEYMLNFNGNYRYLDAAWAQYLHRKGEVGAFIRKNVADAQKKGLGLVVGLNVIRGGPNKRAMTPNEIKSWGSALLSSSYPCAFISWQYNATLLSSSGVEDAMKYLSAKARSRSQRTCRGS